MRQVSAEQGIEEVSREVARAIEAAARGGFKLVWEATARAPKSSLAMGTGRSSRCALRRGSELPPTSP